MPFVAFSLLIVLMNLYDVPLYVLCMALNEYLVSGRCLNSLYSTI